MSDLIDRQAALDAITEYWKSEVDEIPETGFDSVADVCDLILKYNQGVCKVLRAIQSAQSDLSGYSDRLWRNAYERGKRDARAGWIPCSDRLPPEHEEVIASTEHHLYIAEFETVNGNPYWNEVIEYRNIRNVVAWMYLPAPYRKEDQNG